MNKVILMGRLTRDPDVRYSAGENSTAVARYTPVSYTHLEAIPLMIQLQKQLRKKQVSKFR